MGRRPRAGELMTERRRVRSLEESLAEPPPDSEPAEPAAEPEVEPERPPAPEPPVDLSASIRALETRQVRWIRQRERWRSKVAEEEARASAARKAS